MKPLIWMGLCGVLGCLGGCSSQRPAVPQSAPQIYDFRSEGTFPPAPEIVAAPTSAVDASQLDRPASAGLQGWSVQVYAGRSRDVAIDVQHQLQGVVSETVYLDYIEPYYKVRVGDCEERVECDTLQRRLRALGSESAWVVRRTLHP